MNPFDPRKRPFPRARSALFAILLGLSAVTDAFSDDRANPFCPWMFQPVGTPIAVAEAIAARAGLVEKLKTAQIPAFLKDTPNGPIPVIQMNKTTAATPGMTEFLGNSLGVQVFLQPGWRNDHGSFRLGKFMIDVDTPGARNFGELHETGLAWKEVSRYLPRRRDDADGILEVAYSLTPEEMKIANTYQRMRRAAIIRVPFTFGGGDIDRTLPNLLEVGGEHCFLFCNGSQLSTQVRGLRAKVSEFGIPDLDAFLQAPETTDFVAKSDALILTAKLDGNESFPRMLQPLNTTAFMRMARAKGANIPPAKRVVFMNWVYGLVASQRYEKLYRELQISGNIGVQDAAHPRATAILIYSTEVHAPEFQAATFQAKGIFTNWTPVGVRPLHLGE